MDKKPDKARHYKLLKYRKAAHKKSIERLVVTRNNFQYYVFTNGIRYRKRFQRKKTVRKKAKSSVNETLRMTANPSIATQTRQKSLDENLPSPNPNVSVQTSPQKTTSWFDNFTLLDSCLGIVIALIVIVQATIWITAIGKVLVDLNRVEMANLLVNQTAFNDLTKSPLCVEKLESGLKYKVCDTQVLVAADQYSGGTTNNLLIMRRFYGDDGKTLFALDRYEYTSNHQLSQKNRIIFRKILGVYTCSYLETTFDNNGTPIKTTFHGTCGADKNEIPTDALVMPIGPPLTNLTIPYR